MEDSRRSTVLNAPGARSTLRVLDVLEAVARTPGLRLTDIASQTEYAPATLHRALSVLLDRNYLVRDGDSGRYQLGSAAVQLSQTAAGGNGFAHVARQAGAALADETGETVHVAIWRKPELSYLLKWESNKALRVAMASDIGSRIPLHATALGKAVLAAVRASEREAVLTGEGLQRFTGNTVVADSTLQAELFRTQELGYAVDNEEHEPGVRCVGAAIRGARDRVIGAVSVSAPASRLREADIARTGSEVMRAARAIGESLIRY